jgi:hypothetical protein
VSLPEDKKAALLRNAEKVYAHALATGEVRYGKMIHHAFTQLADHNNPAFLLALKKMKRVPVTLDEFIDSNDFLGGQMDIWPKLREDLKLMNPDQLIGEEPVNEVLLGGATGTGKTNTATVTQAYQLYNLLCFDWPQELFSLSRTTPIVFMFSSVSTTITNRVIYKPFRDLFLGMKFTQRYVEFNKQLESSLSIGQNIMVVPALASVQSMVGSAVISGILDEVNFMARVENSKMVVGATGAGGIFDQAEQTYRNLSRRRKSRFITRGISPGVLCVVSSTRYKGDFLDRRVDEIRTTGEKNTLVFRRKQYEVAPQTRYTGERFRLLVGTDRYPTRVLEEHEVPGKHFPAEAEIEMVPVEYLADFKRDAEAALRDIVGIATDAIRPFIAQRDRIIDAINAGRAARLRPVVDREVIVLAEEGLPPLPETFRPQDSGAPRFVHIDLSITSDRCGVAMVRHDGFVQVRGERLPKFAVELAIGIKPDPQNELQISELREWVLRMISRYDLNVVQISYDGFQSRESIQVLRRAGVRATNVSVDKTPEPYESFRSALYDGRLLLPENEVLRQELIQLEWLAHKGKVDHPPRGTKDIADAICGAFFAASKHPIVRTGVRALDDEGKPLRTPFSMQRPSSKMRPSAATRPKPLRERMRDRDLPLPEAGSDTPSDTQDEMEEGVEDAAPTAPAPPAAE